MTTRIFALIKTIKLFAAGLFSLITLSAVGTDYLHARLLTIDPLAVKLALSALLIAFILEFIEVMRLKRKKQ